MVEGGPLSEQAFKDWSKDVVLFCHITSRVDSDPYQDLLGKKGGQGFPHFAVMNGEGKVLKVHQGARDVDGFRDSVAEATETSVRLGNLAAAAAKGDKAAAKELFFLQLELGHLEYGQAVEASKQLDLSDEEKSGLKGRLATLKVNEVLSGIKTRDEFMTVAAPAFVKMADEGEIPTNEDLLQPFWISQMDWAEQEKDVRVFRRALEVLEKMFGDNPRAKRFFDRRREVLEKLEGGGADEDGEE
ncbi:MAG: hypothetical protein KDB80_04540, partial [Planctomycetes bacterium]|nr:hypothetical protein [Planctomycetota bacterium]